MAWTYSDYVTYDRGSATRLTRLRLFKKELLDALSNGKYKLGDHEHDPAVIGNRLAAVDAELDSEEDDQDGATVSFTRGRARKRS